MPRRAILLFVLFVVTSVFYSVVIHSSLPDIQAKQKAQTERFNALDEKALSPEKSGS